MVSVVVLAVADPEEGLVVWGEVGTPESGKEAFLEGELASPEVAQASLVAAQASLAMEGKAFR